MALIIKETKKEENFKEKELSKEQREAYNRMASDKTGDIIKSITWPKITVAMKYALYSVVGASVIAVLLKLYSAGIHQLIG